VEIFVLRVTCVELLRPGAFEVDSIDKDQPSLTVYGARWNNLLDLIVGFLSNPLVDSCC